MATSSERDPRIYTEFSYKSETSSPPQIINTTASLMDAYLSGLPLFDRSHLSYFANESIDLIALTRDGLRTNIHLVDKAGKITKEDLETLMGMSDTPAYDPEATEAFGRAIVTFSFMPEYAKHRLLPDGFSRRGMLAPPVTTMDFLERLDELTSQMMALAGEKLGPEDFKALKLPSLLRTYWFFQTATQLPMKLNETEKDKKEAALFTLGKMLDGINLDL